MTRATPGTRLPRLVVAAPSTGQGKTTVATGLMAALRRTGLTVSGHKVGPDYIDPGYHAVATGRPGRNLDPHLVGEERLVPLLLHGARGADVAVVEGVMGLYDGRVGHAGFASTAHVARATSTPVVLVVDISRASRTIGAVVHGLATYEHGVDVVGVVLNNAGSPRHAAEVTESIRLPVLGVVPRDPALATPSRHLGLVPAAERDGAIGVVEAWADAVGAHVDLDAVLELAGKAPDLDGPAWDPRAEVEPVAGRPVVAVAGGKAFTFRYAETEELLRAAGCEVAAFDPMVDPRPPDGTAAIYLGGGFPEVHARELTDNVVLRRELAAAIARGVPTVAECAGLLYLCSSLDSSPMVGSIAAAAAMTERLTLRYPTLTAATDNLLSRKGELSTGHEFHRTHTAPERGQHPAWTVDGQDVGFAGPTLHASYVHTHWAGHPVLAQRFAEAAAAHQAESSRPVAGALRTSTTEGAAAHVAEVSGLVAGGPRTSTTDGPLEPAAETRDLRHHGDREVGVGLADFAVNVYAGPRPAWLEDALHRGLAEASAYPDPTAAEAAIARHHGRDPSEVLATAGAAEAFTLLARWRPWRRAVVVHPQFTEPHAALLGAGHRVTEVVLEHPFGLDPDQVPDDADLVVVGNPTNPTGVLHPCAAIDALRRPGRVVVVDEAFMDAVPGEPESLAGTSREGLVVLRSLTKHWGIPGVRAGYLLADARSTAELRAGQTPWSVSSTAIAAMLACTSPAAAGEAARRAVELTRWRHHLERGLTAQRIAHVPSRAPYVLAHVGAGVHGRLRDRGLAVRRADTFPGLDDRWVRIAVRDRPAVDALLTALADALG